MSKNEWSHTSTPQYEFMGWFSVEKESTGITLPFHYLRCAHSPDLIKVCGKVGNFLTS
jgi:hypothetical protein